MEATVNLAKGPAVITLSGVKDTDYCCFGDRNIDVVVLHPNSTDVDRRINGTADPADGQVLPLDGLFSQAVRSLSCDSSCDTPPNCLDGFYKRICWVVCGGFCKRRGKCFSRSRISTPLTIFPCQSL